MTLCPLRYQGLPQRFVLHCRRSRVRRLFLAPCAQVRQERERRGGPRFRQKARRMHAPPERGTSGPARQSPPASGPARRSPRASVRRRSRKKGRQRPEMSVPPAPRPFRKRLPQFGFGQPAPLTRVRLLPTRRQRSRRASSTRLASGSERSTTDGFGFRETSRSAHRTPKASPTSIPLSTAGPGTSRRGGRGPIGLGRGRSTPPLAWLSGRSTWTIFAGGARVAGMERVFALRPSRPEMPVRALPSRKRGTDDADAPPIVRLCSLEVSELARADKWARKDALR